MTTSSSAPVVYLHIGTPKSGTSYLQALLGVNRQKLADQGVLWAGKNWGAQVAAVKDLRQLKGNRRLRPRGAWLSLVSEAKQWPGRAVVISMEWLVNLTPRQIEAALDSLQPCRVEVICTARDPARTIPAQWQEAMKNGRTWTWREYIEGAAGEEPTSSVPGRVFWRMQDVAAIARRWLAHVASGQFHVVTLPPADTDRSALWERMCSILDLDPAAFQEPKRRNESLGSASAQFLWHVNERLAQQDRPPMTFRVAMKRDLARAVLAKRKAGEGRLVLPEEQTRQVSERARQLIAELDELGVHVVGDLKELLPAPATESGTDPAQVPTEELLEVGIDAVAGLVGLPRTVRDPAEDTGRQDTKQADPTVQLPDRRVALRGVSTLPPRIAAMLVRRARQRLRRPKG